MTFDDFDFISNELEQKLNLGMDLVDKLVGMECEMDADRLATVGLARAYMSLLARSGTLSSQSFASELRSFGFGDDVIAEVRDQTRIRTVSLSTKFQVQIGQVRSAWELVREMTDLR